MGVRSPIGDDPPLPDGHLGNLLGHNSALQQRLPPMEGLPRERIPPSLMLPYP